jgi:hypothetical protein
MEGTGRSRWPLWAAVVAFLAAAGGATFVFFGAPARRPFRDSRFITLGELGRELANDPGTYDLILDKLGNGRTGYGLVGTAEKLALKRLFAAADYEALDRHPVTTLQELKLGLGVLASQRAPSSADAGAEAAADSPPVREALGVPTGLPGPTGEPYLDSIGVGLLHGDHLDLEKSKRFKDSERFAAVLNRLTLNVPGQSPKYEVTVGDQAIGSLDALLQALAKAGNAVTVRDERFLANFGDLEWKGHSVATPLWVDTGRRLAGGEKLVLPVPHEQLTLSVRGALQMDATFYNSLDLTGEGDGGTLFRADVTGDQPWVGGRVFHVYAGEQALQVAHLMGALRRVADEKVRQRKLPLDGYFALGVCTMAPALAEQAVFGKTTAWPLTHDAALFDSDSEIDRLVRALPFDAGDKGPENERVLASVPWAEVKDVPLPWLRESLGRL